MPRQRKHDIHPYIPELKELLRKGRIGRREFLRGTTRLGLSAAAAYAMAGVVASPGRALAQAPKKGGTLRVSMNVKEISDPATYDWSEKANAARQIIEPLVQIDVNNVARGHLAESWSASPDLKTWTFKLRRGVKWSNGDAFTADDVVFNFKRWLDPKTGSSNQGRFSAMTTRVDTGEKDKDGKPVMRTQATEGAVEKVDEHTVRFHLNRPDLSLPESMADYPALIVHRRFEEMGKNLAKNPIGTGPYALKEFAVGEKAVLVRRTDGPWWGGEPYLDGITYIDHGDDPNAQIAALASGQVDANHQTSIEQVATLRSIPSLTVYEQVTATTGVARMKISAAPFNNKKVRQAIQACADHDKLLGIVYQGLGAPGEDHHVAPVHPEYAKIPKQKQDYALAKKLLAEGGHPNGLKIAIDCVATPTWEQNAVKALAEMCRPAGIDIAINILPGKAYWDRWLETPFGFTSWAHRALGVQVLNLAYRSGVRWNETSYANPAFDKLLDDASGKLDVNERRKDMEKLQRMLQDDAIIVQPLWRSVFTTANKRVKGYFCQVALEHHYTKVWLDT